MEFELMPTVSEILKEDAQNVALTGTITFWTSEQVDITEARSISMSEAASVDITLSDNSELDLDDRSEERRYEGHRLSEQTSAASSTMVSLPCRIPACLITTLWAPTWMGST